MADMNAIAEGQVAQDIGMEGQPLPEEGAGQVNPVIDALKTVGIFIQAQEEKGNPNAQQLKAQFEQLLQGVAAMAGQAGPEQAPAPEQAVGPSPGSSQLPPNAAEGGVPIL